MMAGRCISVTHEALGSVRISPTSMAVGQAAGIAAASAVKTSRQPSKVDVEAVRTEITAQGGML
jgi:FAD dependent oxidoreductase